MESPHGSTSGVGASTTPRVAWILNHYAQPASQPGGTRHYELVRRSAVSGWNVKIVAASTSLGPRTAARRVGRRVSTSVAEGVHFTWLRCRGYNGNGVGRYLNMAEFAVTATLPRSLAHLESPDVVVGSSVHPLAALAAYVLARRHRASFVFEVRDLWPETLVAFGAIRKGGLVDRGLRSLVGGLYRKADAIITTMPLGADCVVEYGVPAEKVTWVPNGVSLEAPPGGPVGDAGSGFCLMYLGAHGQANGLSVLVDAMARLREDGPDMAVRLVLVGEGPVKAALEQRVVEQGLSGCVEFRSPVPHTEVASTMAEADALAFVAVDLPELYRYGMSTNKMGDYLASGLPVLAAVALPTDPVSESGGGIVTSVDPREYAAGLIRLIGMSDDERRELGGAGRRYAETHFDFDLLAERFFHVLDGVSRAATSRR